MAHQICHFLTLQFPKLLGREHFLGYAMVLGGVVVLLTGVSFQDEQSSVLHSGVRTKMAEVSSKLFGLGITLQAAGWSCGVVRFNDGHTLSTHASFEPVGLRQSGHLLIGSGWQHQAVVPTKLALSKTKLRFLITSERPSQFLRYDSTRTTIRLPK